MLTAAERRKHIFLCGRTRRRPVDPYLQAEKGVGAEAFGNGLQAAVSSRSPAGLDLYPAQREIEIVVGDNYSRGLGASVGRHETKGLSAEIHVGLGEGQQEAPVSDADFTDQGTIFLFIQCCPVSFGEFGDEEKTYVVTGSLIAVAWVAEPCNDVIDWHRT